MDDDNNAPMDDDMERGKAFAVALARLVQEHKMDAPDAAFAFGFVAYAMAKCSDNRPVATQELIHSFMAGFGMKVVKVDDDTAEEVRSPLTSPTDNPLH